jgi:deoxyadenosine/deoxycytidine kinase
MRDDELKLYENLLATIEHKVPQPDLVIYLQSSVDRLMENIEKRDRVMERNMSETYIRELNEAYNYFFFRYKSAPLLIVKATDIDFVNNPEHFEDLLQQILRPNKAPIEYYNPFVRRT